MPWAKQRPGLIEGNTVERHYRWERLSLGESGDQEDPDHLAHAAYSLTTLRSTAGTWSLSRAIPPCYRRPKKDGLLRLAFAYSRYSGCGIVA